MVTNSASIGNSCYGTETRIFITSNLINFSRSPDAFKKKKKNFSGTVNIDCFNLHGNVIALILSIKYITFLFRYRQAIKFG